MLRGCGQNAILEPESSGAGSKLLGRSRAWPLGNRGRNKVKIKMVPVKQSRSFEAGVGRGWVVHVDPDVACTDGHGMEDCEQCQLLDK